MGPRAQALKDGEIIDVTPMAVEMGFRFPTAISHTLRDKLMPTDEEYKIGQSFAGRLQDVLGMLRVMIRTAKTPSRDLTYEVTIVKKKKGETIKVTAMTLPGDNMEPTLTLILPRDWR